MVRPGPRGGSISTSGTRDAAYGPNGAAAGGTRDTSVNTAGGRTYDGSRTGGVAVGHYGRTVGRATGYGTAAPPTADWKPLGVFALVPGDQKTSNKMFQLAVDKNGIIRGNYYDGVMDTTTPVFGSVDKKTQRASAWTIGKTKDRVFEAGLYNLTQTEAPVLVHLARTRRNNGCSCGWNSRRRPGSEWAADVSGNWRSGWIA